MGVASGGLWKTENLGTTFKPIFDNQPVFSIGCLAMDSNNTKVVWVGTGENNSQRNLAYGNGVYKTTDGGKSFTNMGLKTSSQIGKIMIDPRNSNVVYVSAQGQAWGMGGKRGLYKTSDGGKTWTRILEIGEYTGVSDMEMDPRNPDILYASSHQRERVFIQKLMVAPNRPFTNRIILMDTRAALSDDGGKTWVSIEGRDKHVDNQAIWIDPEDTNHYIMGCDGGLYESYDRAETWQFKNNLPITQYYHVRTDNEYPFYNVYGGAQDNGSWFGPSQTKRQDIVNADWTYTIGGDGYLSIPDPNNPDILIANRNTVVCFGTIVQQETAFQFNRNLPKTKNTTGIGILLIY